MDTDLDMDLRNFTESTVKEERICILKIPTVILIYMDFSTYEALDKFIEFYNRRVLKGNKSFIQVVHGYGSSGVGGRAICNILRNYLSGYPEKVLFQPGIEVDDPYDASTYIYPRDALPQITTIIKTNRNEANSLDARVLRFLKTPKTAEKIEHKFFKCSYVMAIVWDLCYSGEVEEIIKGKYKQYVAKNKY